MNHFCAQCGTPLDEGSGMCPKCHEAAPQADVTVCEQKKKFFTEKKIVVLVIVGGIILGLLLGVVVVWYKNPCRVARKMCEGYYHMDYDMMSEYSIYSLEAYMNEELTVACEKEGITLQEGYQKIEETFQICNVICDINSTQDMMDAYKELWRVNYSDRFGEDYQIFTEVTAYEKMTDSQLQYQILQLSQNVFINGNIDEYIEVDRIRMGYEVTVECNIIGSEDTETITEVFYIVWYKGDWKNLKQPESDTSLLVF